MINEEHKYEIPKQAPPGIPISVHLEDLIEIRSLIESFGIITEKSRLERYEKFLRNLISGVDTKPESVFHLEQDSLFKSSEECYIYVLREIHELMWILQGMRKKLPNGIEPKIAQIVGGRDFAFLDENSTSRNAQFELRIASYFCQHGYSVDLSSDTDIIVVTDNYAFYIECKRVGSSKQLRKRLSEAKFQLKKRMPKKYQGKPVFGCVAADVTKVAFEHNGCTFGLIPDHSKDVIQNKLIEVSMLAQRDDLYSGCRGMIVCWLQIHIASKVLMLNIPTTRFSTNHILKNNMSRKELRAAMFFMKIVKAVSVDDPRAGPPRKVQPRSHIEIPAGTKFDFEESIFIELIESGDISGLENNDIIGRMELNGHELEFTYRELKSAIEFNNIQFEESDKSDYVQFGIKVLVTLYGLRFPLEVLENE